MKNETSLFFVSEIAHFLLPVLFFAFLAFDGAEAVETLGCADTATGPLAVRCAKTME